jgi:TonB dependent receptor-like, beta-barrel
VGNRAFVNPATVASLALDASGLEARYGGRLSSATLFETRDGPTSRRLTISGSAGLTSGDVLAEGRLPGTVAGSWWATMRGTYYRVVADRFKDGDIPSFVDFQFKVTVRLSSRTRLSVLGLAGAEAMVRPILSPPDQRQGYAAENLREFHAHSRLAIVNFQWTPSSRVSTTTTIDAYSNASRDQDAWIDWQTGQPFDRRVRVVDFAARQQVSIAWSPRYVLDLGGEVHGLRGSWAMKGINLLPTRPQGPDILGHFVEYDGPIDTRLERTQIGAWAQERVPLGAGFGIDPGLRLDWNSFTREMAVQPRFRVTKSIGESSMVWAGVAWQAQTPGFETMQQGAAYYDLIGSSGSDLRNERSRQIVGGVEQHLKAGMTLRVEAYHREFDRLMTQRLETDIERQTRLSRYLIPDDMPPDSAILENRPTADPESTGTGRATGVEFLLDRSRGRVSGWVSYALSKSD